MEWDLETCAWNGASKLEIQDNSYNNHAGSNLLGINNTFSMDLKLGRLEDIREESLKNSMPFNMASLSSSSSVRVLEQTKRGRPRNQGTRENSVSCLVDGCNFDLNMCREYHRRHKVCERHSKTPVVLVRGKEQRFCQQCSRFHSLEEFDEAKRSCRKRLDGHNRRRRKRQPQSFYMPESARGFLSSHTGDGMLQFCCPQMNNWNWATMSQPDNNQQTTYQPDESGCALSLLSRYPSQSSGICVGPPTMLAMTMNTDLNLNSNLVQLSYSQSLEFIDTSLSSSTNASNF